MKPRHTPPTYPPHPEIVRLRDAGWRMADIAGAIGVCERQCWRWFAGDCRPLPVFDRALRALGTERTVAA